MLIARDDPLDTYLVHHPEALLGKPVERVVIDPANPYVVGPQLLCAATEFPLEQGEVDAWRAGPVARELVDDGLLRQRSGKFFPAAGLDPHGWVDIRGGGPEASPSSNPAPGDCWATPKPGGLRRPCIPGGLHPPGRELPGGLLDLDAGMAFAHLGIPATGRNRGRSPTSGSPEAESGSTTGR